MIGNYHKWHAGQLWNTIDGVQWAKEFAEEMGEPDLSMSCLTVREPTNSTGWIEEQAEDHRLLP